MSDPEVERANYDEIDFDDQLALYKDEPFTGIIYADYADGSAEISYRYVDGLPSGLQRRWYPNGQIEEEWDAIRGHGAAWSRKWYANGQLEYERLNKDNDLVEIRRWTEDGKSIP